MISGMMMLRVIFEFIEIIVFSFAFAFVGSRVFGRAPENVHLLRAHWKAIATATVIVVAYNVASLRPFIDGLLGIALLSLIFGVVGSRLFGSPSQDVNVLRAHWKGILAATVIMVCFQVYLAWQNARLMQSLQDLQQRM